MNQKERFALPALISPSGATDRKKSVRPLAATTATVLTFAALVLGAACFAQAPRTAPGASFGATPSAANPGANRILRKMLSAEATLSISGKQTTLLFRANGVVVQSDQMVYRQGPVNYRCEFLSPPRLVGDVLVSHGNMSWHYSPSKKDLKIGGPHPRHLMTQIGPALAALKTGLAQAKIVGSDVVAGIPTKIVQISSAEASRAPSIRIWIDPSTGAQLETEVYDTGGTVQSLSFFTTVDYNPSFPPGAFDEPTVAAGTTTEIEHRYSQLRRYPTDTEAGFHVLAPKFVPAGFQFSSASLFMIAGKKAVALRFQGRLTLLSVFESPRDSSGPGSDQASSPRSGTVMLNRRDMQFAAMGTLDNQTMLKVLNSLQ